MRVRDFNALNDRLFKYLFGREERKNLTLSFINAVLGLEGARAFVDLRFADREMDAHRIDGKAAALDLNCVLSDGTQVNIEVQVRCAILRSARCSIGQTFTRTRSTAGRTIESSAARPQSICSGTAFCRSRRFIMYTGSTTSHRDIG